MWRLPRYDNWGLSEDYAARSSARHFRVVTSLSALRIVGAPAFIFLFISPVSAERAASLYLLLVLFVSDVVDGALARHWGVTSHFGYILDGVGDRSTHLAMVVALTALSKMSALLAFFLILRDILLYASRSLFGTWWHANSHFRSRVRHTAVLFKLTVGGLIVLSYNETWHWWQISRRLSNIHDTLVVATWIFALWSYALLVDQVSQYIAIDKQTPGGKS